MSFVGGRQPPRKYIYTKERIETRLLLPLSQKKILDLIDLDTKLISSEKRMMRNKEIKREMH